ncbi:hypothetical protein BRC89_00930 [Halobacteriales archaeon QS_4_70_19]|nr:MAG: hypothetical protein BRC89_00930 [Halobacteriales archaeon QS_4_70_19]
MLERLLPGPLAAAYERDLPEPTHVPNLLAFSSRTWYRRYGAAVYPLLRAVGGRPRWFGSHRRTYHGERQCEEFGIVEYPSHRRFLLMIGNPYYALINHLRRRGVSHFEAGFTSPVTNGSLGRHEFLLTVRPASPATSTSSVNRPTGRTRDRSRTRGSPASPNRVRPLRRPPSTNSGTRSTT